MLEVIVWNEIANMIVMIGIRAVAIMIVMIGIRVATSDVAVLIATDSVIHAHKRSSRERSLLSRDDVGNRRGSVLIADLLPAIADLFSAIADVFSGEFIIGRTQ